MGNSITHASDSTHSNNSATHNRRSLSPSTTNNQKRSSYYEKNPKYQDSIDRKSKTLPARTSANSTSAKRSTFKFQSRNSSHRTTPTSNSSPPNGETSRVLFLLYLIHRTWNVVVETVDTRSKRSRRSTPSSNVDDHKKHTTSVNRNYFDNAYAANEFSLPTTDLDDVADSSICCSQYSFCSCSNCYGTISNQQNFYNSIAEDCSTDSIGERSVSRCESDFSTYYEQSFQMAPSVCQNSPKLPPHAGSKNNAGNAIIIGGSSASSIAQKSNCGSNSLNGSMVSYKMSSSENSWPQSGVYNKENQRPPVYNPEDYAQSLKKFGKRQSGQNARSIYDTNDTIELKTEENFKSATLPGKHMDYKSPIPSPIKSESEMSLRQFASITDLLTKLRADLRVSFPSFVQEFIASPSDGVSLLLEVLRAIQLSQATNSILPSPSQMTATVPRNAQVYQRRALLDELACLQCLTICCTRSPEATSHLGTTPVGLMPLATSATGQGIRARILALQLLSAACDKNTLGHGSQKAVAAGHTAVTEAMSTLRLRCSEPVRFRLLVGMLNSGGGSGELQAAGLKFFNTFLDSAENLQQRLYLQAELFQAGFDPTQLAKTISSSSPWLDMLRLEMKRFNELYIDVNKMITQARDADRVRTQMVILERRVQILHEEKAVLTSMERRLQERCADLQREIFRLQGAQHENSFKSLDKQPTALPRHVPPKQNASEHEDEGISSSETGPSLSPVPILVLPQESNLNMQKNNDQNENKTKGNKINNDNDNDDDVDVDADDVATIEDVMEELDHIVSEAEKQIITNANENKRSLSVEQDIVPVNIVPQPPRKSRSLAHLVSHAGGSCELDGSEYGMLMLQNLAGAGCAGDGGGGGVGGCGVVGSDQAIRERTQTLQAFFDETGDYNLPEMDKPYTIESPDIPEVNANNTAYNTNTTRDLLDVIMNARQTEDDPTIKAFQEASARQQNRLTSEQISLEKKQQVTPPAQHFNGVFFMTGMNKPQKYPKPDLTAALQARRVTKNLERLEAAFASHESLNEPNCGTGVAAAHPAREKSRSNQQIYFGSNPTMRLGSTNGSCGQQQQQQQTIHTVSVTSALVGHNNNNISKRTRSYTQGSKVTDVISGLY